MVASLFPYIDHGRPRQSPRLVREAWAVGLALALGGCSAMGLPFGEASKGPVSLETTGSIPAKAATADPVDSSDWETVRRTVARIPLEAEASEVEWSNPDTGSTGTIATLAAPIDRSGVLCRAFATTVSDTRGIHLYRGEACQASNGRWRLHGMSADDARLS